MAHFLWENNRNLASASQATSSTFTRFPFCGTVNPRIRPRFEGARLHTPLKNAVRAAVVSRHDFKDCGKCRNEALLYQGTTSQLAENAETRRRCVRARLHSLRKMPKRGAVVSRRDFKACGKYRNKALLYQGTSLLVPHTAWNDAGFSPCAVLKGHGFQPCRIHRGKTGFSP